MSDSFFGFDTDMPALGAGMEDGGALMDAPEDEEVDLLNDQTFGDGALEGDWEEIHEELTEKLTHSADLSEPSKYKKQQEELAQSIRKLIVEDEATENNDMFVPSGRPIPGKREVNLDDLFGPSSPPGLLHAEEIMHGEQNIWGSPVRGGRDHKQQAEGIQGLLKTLQAPKPNSVHGDTFHDPSIVMAGKSVSASLPQARTVNDIEQEIIGGAGDATRSRALTVQELERELQGGGAPWMSSTAPPSLPLPIGTPPAGHFIHQARNGHSHSSPISTLFHGQPTGMVGTAAVRGAMPNTQSPAMLPTQRSGSPAVVGILQRTSPPLVPPQQQQAPQTQQGGTASSRRSSSPNVTGILQRTSPPPVPGQQHQPQAQPGDMPPHCHPSPSLSHSPSPPLPSTSNGHICSGLGLSPSHSFIQCSRGASLVRSLLQDVLANGHQGPAHGSPVPIPGRTSGARGSPMIWPDRPPFLSGTPPHQRMPMPRPYSDQVHFRGRGPPPRMPFPNHPGPRHTVHDKNQGNYPRDERNRISYPREERHLGPRPAGPPGGYQRMVEERHFHRDHGNFYGNIHRNRPPFQDPFFRRRGPGHYPQNLYPPKHWEDGRGDAVHEQRDEFAGLMTQREKDWVIKIQLMQLQTENPYLDDYYFTCWRMKEAAREIQKQKEKGVKSNGEPTLVLPHLARLETRAYKPMQFEGALGRLTASSVHNPRKIIDVTSKDISDNEDLKAKEIRRYKELLFEIEAGFDLLLDIDDIEKKVLALPEEHRQSLFDERHNKIQRLFTQLHCRDNCSSDFRHVIAVRKGIKLVSRLMMLLPQNDARILVTAILSHLPQLFRKDLWKDTTSLLFESVSYVVGQADLATLAQLAEVLLNDQQKKVLATALQNKFGSSVIWLLVGRGEVVHSTQSPLDMDIAHQDIWGQFVRIVAEALEATAIDKLCQPHAISDAISMYMETLVDRKTYAGIEEQLRWLATTQETT